MRAKSLVLIVIALGCGLVAAIGINQVLAHRNTPVAAQIETSPILVALVDVPLGSELTAAQVKLEQWPKDKIPAGAVSDITQVEGRRLRAKLYAGEPILEAKLLDKDASAPGLAPLVPKGYRVVSVKVDSVSGSSGLILPHDRVDVLVHLQKNPGRGIPDTMTRTLLKDVKVVAVNEVYSRDDQTGSDGSINAKTISLLVTPSQAQMVTMATELGSIRLVMRGLEDDEHDNAESVTLSQLLGIRPGKQDRDSESLMPDEEPELTLPEPPQRPVESTVAQAKPWRMILVEGPKVRELELGEGNYQFRVVDPDDGADWPDAADHGDGPAPAGAATGNGEGGEYDEEWLDEDRWERDE